MMNSFVTEDISAKKMKPENPHSQIKFEVKEEPVSIGEWNAFSGQQFATDEPIEADSPVREEGELLIADYEMSNVEIQEETVTETFFDDNTNIPNTAVQDELFISHSSGSESTAFIAHSAIEIYNGEPPDTGTSTKDEEIFKFQCGECEYRSPNMVTMQQHLKTHTRDTLFRCDTCDYTSTNLESLTYHLQRHADISFIDVVENNYEIDSSNSQDVNTKELMCHECNYCFSDLVDLKAHMSTHRDQMPFHCTKCNFCASDQEIFNRHLKIHQDIKLYKCEECLFTTNLNSKLSAHMKEHTVVAQENYFTSKSKKKKVIVSDDDDDEDEDWRPKSKVVVTDSRSTRQGFHDPALKRALKISLTERRKKQKRSYNKQISYSPETRSSWPSCFSREEVNDKRTHKAKKCTTAKQRLAKIMKIKNIPIYKR